MDTCNEFLRRAKRTRSGLREPLRCKDGFSISVQVGKGYRCTPKTDDAGSYHTVECALASDVEPLLLGYAEEPDCPRSTEYDYVPVNVMNAVIEKHGGIVCLADIIQNASVNTINMAEDGTKLRAGGKDVYDLDKNIYTRYEYTPVFSMSHLYAFLFKKTICDMTEHGDIPLATEYSYRTTIDKADLRELYRDAESFWEHRVVLPDAVDIYEPFGGVMRFKKTACGSFQPDIMPLKPLSKEVFRNIATELAKLSDTTDQYNMITLDSLTL